MATMPPPPTPTMITSASSSHDAGGSTGMMGAASGRFASWTRSTSRAVISLSGSALSACASFDDAGAAAQPVSAAPPSAATLAARPPLTNALRENALADSPC